jgi:hypothetical protein
MPRHLLHGGEVDTEVEQIPDPSSAQIVRCGGLDLGLEAALPADPPACRRAEPRQLTAVPQ